MTIKTNAFKRYWVTRSLAGLCALAVVAGLAVVPSAPAHAELRIDITRGEVKPMPLPVSRVKVFRKPKSARTSHR